MAIIEKFTARKISNKANVLSILSPLINRKYRVINYESSDQSKISGIEYKE